MRGVTVNFFNFGGIIMSNDLETKVGEAVAAEVTGDAKAAEKVKGEISKLVKDEIDKAVKAAPASGSDVSRQLEDISSSLKSVAEAEQKKSFNSRISAIGSIALLLVFIILFAVLTPNVLSLLRNLNSTMSNVGTVIDGVNGLVADVDGTVRDLNGVVTNVGDQVDGAFTEVNGVISSVSGEVDTLLGSVDTSVKDVLGSVVTTVDGLQATVDSIGTNANDGRANGYARPDRRTRRRSTVRSIRLRASIMTPSTRRSHRSRVL